MMFAKLAVATLSTLMAATLIPAHAQTVLTSSSWVPPGHTLTRTIIEWGKELETATQGRIKLTMLPKTPTNAPGTYDSVRDGLQDVGFTVQGYTPGRFTLAPLAELPFLEIGRAHV